VTARHRRASAVGWAKAHANTVRWFTKIDACAVPTTTRATSKTVGTARKNAPLPTLRRRLLLTCARGQTPALTGGYSSTTEAAMNEDVFNTSIRKFLKTLGVTGQREIEKAVRQALADGKLKGNEKLPAKATITLGGVNLSHEIKGEIELE